MLLFDMPLFFIWLFESNVTRFDPFFHSSRIYLELTDYFSLFPRIPEYLFVLVDLHFVLLSQPIKLI